MCLHEAAHVPGRVAIAASSLLIRPANPDGASISGAVSSLFADGTALQAHCEAR